MKCRYCKERVFFLVWLYCFGACYICSKAEERIDTEKREAKEKEEIKQYEMKHAKLEKKIDEKIHYVKQKLKGTSTKEKIKGVTA